MRKWKTYTYRGREKREDDREKQIETDRDRGRERERERPRRRLITFAGRDVETGIDGCAAHLLSVNVFLYPFP